MEDQRKSDGAFKGAYCYNVLKTLFDGDSSIKIACTQGSPFANMTTVTVIGKKIMFDDPRWFLKIGKIVSNFEVYPTTNGVVVMTFTFYDSKEANG